MLARIGGDEFVVVLPGIATSEDALIVAEMIRCELNRPIDLTGGYRVQIACSIGVAIYPEHGEDDQTLSKNADDALYVAKEHGRNQVVLHGGTDGKSDDAAGGRDLSFIRFVWQRSYRCGEESIDREHHELFDRANTLMHAAMAGEWGEQQVQVALDELVDSVVRHFANEESILARHGYTGLDDHAAAHRALVEHAEQLRRQAANGEVSLGELVTYLSQELVVKHMLKEDRKFYSLFQTSPEARREDGQEYADDSRLAANDR
ncbi:MAG: bacteriohemerythrin [Propionivibrio sp.]